MISKEQIIQIVIGVVRNFVETNRIAIDEINKDTLLYSYGGICLDSMDLVRFILQVEDLFRKNGFPITIAAEKALSQINSPFYSVLTLSDFIFDLI